jgi:hypothetical protein
VALPDTHPDLLKAVCGPWSPVICTACRGFDPVMEMRNSVAGGVIRNSGRHQEGPRHLSSKNWDPTENSTSELPTSCPRLTDPRPLRSPSLSKNGSANRMANGFLGDRQKVDDHRLVKSIDRMMDEPRPFG